MQLKRVWIPWIACFGVGAAWAAFALHDPHPDLIAFLQVGQGDATLIASNGSAVLVDVGPRHESHDAGKRFVVPALERLGVERVSLIVLTHPDMDHVGGLGSVVKAHPSAKVAASAAFRDHPEMRLRLQEAGVSPQAVVWLDRDARLSVGDFSVEALCPPLPDEAKDNDGSIFLKIRSGGATAVLTGDAPWEVEGWAQGRGDWRAQILKAGHHGSKSSTSTDWLAEVRPTWVVFSAGRNNRYGHPAPEVLRRAESAGATPLRTDSQGDLVFDLTPGGFVLRR